jgi:hypothetical protein
MLQPLRRLKELWELPASLDLAAEHVASLGSRVQDLASLVLNPPKPRAARATIFLLYNDNEGPRIIAQEITGAPGSHVEHSIQPHRPLPKGVWVVVTGGAKLVELLCGSEVQTVTSIASPVAITHDEVLPGMLIRCCLAFHELPQ